MNINYILNYMESLYVVEKDKITRKNKNELIPNLDLFEFILFKTFYLYYILIKMKFF